VCPRGLPPEASGDACRILIFQARGFSDELDSHSVVHILVAYSCMFRMCSSSKQARSDLANI
jgi:hypothetical protein